MLQGLLCARVERNWITRKYAANSMLLWARLQECPLTRDTRMGVMDSLCQTSPLSH
jgi:hypothetical protein